MSHHRRSGTPDGTEVSTSEALLVEPSAHLPDPARRRHGPALARAVDLPGARRGHRRRHDQERELPLQRRRLAQPAAQPVDPGAARGRPGGRDHHPQRRPVRRLGARRSRRTSPAGCSSTSPASRSWRSSSSCIARRGACSAWSTACWSPSSRCPRWSSRSARSTSTAASCSPGRAATGSTPATCRSDFLALGTKAVLTIPVLTIIALVVLAAVGYYLLHRTRRPRALRDRLRPRRRRPLRPASVRRRVLAAFVLSGALAGLAGVLYAARYGTVSSGAGSGIELQAVAAVVIGGVAIFGGSGTVWGAAIGAVPAGHHQPRAAQPRHRGLLAARRRRRADPRRHRPRPGPGQPPGHASSSKRGTRMSTIDRRAAAAPTPTYSAAAVAAGAAHPRVGGHRPARRGGRSTRIGQRAELRRPADAKFLLQDIAPILLIALPMTLIIITGEIDLSVASILGLSSVLLGVLHERRLSDPGRRAARAPASARVCGALNGFLVAYVGLPSLAVTIGTLALYRGHRGRPARHQGGHRLPREVDRPGHRAPSATAASRWS